MLRRFQGQSSGQGTRFQSIAQRECYERIGAWLRIMYGQEAVFDIETAAGFGVLVGSAMTTVSAVAAQQNDVAILIASRVISTPQLNQDLLVQLLMENFNEMPFASFGLDGNGDIWLMRIIMGNCSTDDFVMSVTAVASRADEYDDVIASQWGGNRAIDNLDEGL